MSDIDNHKLMYHPERVAEWRTKGDCFPIYVEIGLTDKCNHRCSFCALDWVESAKNYFDSSILLQSIENMAKCGVKSIMYAGEGEPLLHRDFSKIVKHTKDTGIDVSLTSNGVLFNEKIAESSLQYFSWTRFSVNAGNKESYSKIHQVSEKEFDKAISNIRFMSELKKKNNLNVTIGVQSLILSENINTLEDLAKICQEAGTDNLQLKPYSHHPLSKNDFSVPSEALDLLESKISKYNTNFFKVIYRRNTINRINSGITYPECFGLPFFTLIDASGNIMPCNLYYGNLEFFYGNLNEESFEKIWTGEKRKKVLENLRKKGVDQCRLGCRLDVINRYLYRLKKPGEHDNFI